MSRQKGILIMSNSLTVDLVTTDGRIDQDASKAAFDSALIKRVAELETEQTQIAEAVSALFDQYLGKPIAMPTLGSMVAQRLNAQPENFKVLSDRALEYVRANSQSTGSEEDGNLVLHPESEFVIGKGKGGGCYRRADAPVKPAKK
jgi:hypothetical protein